MNQITSPLQRKVYDALVAEAIRPGIESNVEKVFENYQKEMEDITAPLRREGYNLEEVDNKFHALDSYLTANIVKNSLRIEKILKKKDKRKALADLSLLIDKNVSKAIESYFEVTPSLSELPEDKGTQLKYCLFKQISQVLKAKSIYTNHSFNDIIYGIAQEGEEGLLDRLDLFFDELRMEKEFKDLTLSIMHKVDICYQSPTV